MKLPLLHLLVITTQALLATSTTTEAHKHPNPPPAATTTAVSGLTARSECSPLDKSYGCSADNKRCWRVCNGRIEDGNWCWAYKNDAISDNPYYDCETDEDCEGWHFCAQQRKHMFDMDKCGC